jgi:SAM-dependent methyltransferase
LHHARVPAVSEQQVSYAKKTFEDSNSVKRYFQKSRLKAALRLAGPIRDPGVIVDFGAGNGELCKHLAVKFPMAEITCYEPHPELMEQARENLAGASNVIFAGEPSQLPVSSTDLLFCLEVFEHLPEPEFGAAMKQVDSALADDGVAVIGVPIETGMPALYKGLFRIIRRFGEFDTRPRNIISALVGRPPTDRPVVELLPGSWFYLHHLGFDHRRFRASLGARFKLLKFSASPFPILGAAINSEANFVVTRATNPRD